MRWSYDTQQDGGPVEFHSDPLVIEDLVVVGSDRRKPGGTAHLYAFERATGKPRWKYRVDLGVASDVVRIGPNIYALTLQDELLCVDWKTGELVWKSATGQANEEFLLSSSPAASRDQIFFGGLDGTVYALDANSGAVLWRRDLSGRISTSVLLVVGSLYAGNTNRHLYRLDSGTGAVTADLATEEIPAERLLFADGSLLVFFADKKLVCLDSSLKTIRWSKAASAPWSSSKPYAWKHAVLIGNEKGELFAYRISDGSLLWSEKFEGVIRGIGQSEDALYVGTIKGRVYAYKLSPTTAVLQ